MIIRSWTGIDLLRRVLDKIRQTAERQKSKPETLTDFSCRCNFEALESERKKRPIENTTKPDPRYKKEQRGKGSRTNPQCSRSQTSSRRPEQSTLSCARVPRFGEKETETDRGRNLAAKGRVTVPVREQTPQGCGVTRKTHRRILIFFVPHCNDGFCGVTQILGGFHCRHL